jgi:uroporphyrinogen-III decarboxylase
VVEPLLKDTSDVELYLSLPDEVFSEVLDLERLKNEELALGDTGIVMVDTEDPVCAVAGLFDMATFPVFAITEQSLCHRLLEKHATVIQKRTEAVAKEFPGRLWRIYGPEYVTEPFLPAPFFDDYVVRYTGPMVREIKDHGGFARVHVHGRIRNVLDKIVGMGADGIDPIEPPPHGDVELKDVRERYGKQLVLYGNIEISDLEQMSSDRFRLLVRKSIADGTCGEGRGFVLMTTASPYGREISTLTLRNYQIMIEEIEGKQS